MGTHDHIVYIYDEHDVEVEVDMELLEDGFPYGIITSNGTEIRLTTEQEDQARHAYNIKREEYDCYRSDYYNA